MDSVSGVFVPVEVLAQEQGTSTEAVVERIQSGELVGRRQSNGWHVLVRVPPQSGGQAAPAPGVESSGPVTAELRGPVRLEGRPDVVVRDLQISLTSLIGLILKLAVALIVAGVILGGIGFGLWLLVEAYGQPLVNMVMELIGPYLP